MILIKCFISTILLHFIHSTIRVSQYFVFISLIFIFHLICTSSKKRSLDQRPKRLTNYFLYGVFDQGWYEFHLKHWHLHFGFCENEVPILFQGISDTTKIVIYYIVTIGSSEKKVPWSGFIFHFIMKMVKRNISFYERKKKLLQKHEFCTKGKLHIMGKFLFWIFQRSEIQCSFDSKVDVRLYFL